MNAEIYLYVVRSLFLAILGGGLLVLAIRRLRQFRIRERYAVVFMLLGLPFIVLAFWQEGVAYLAQMVGVQYNTFALICVSAFLILAVFELLTIVSVQDRKITTLAQTLAILQQRMDATDDRARVSE